MKKIFLNLFVFLAGMVLLFIGVYQIYPPAAFVLVGLILTSISLFGEGKR